MQFNPEPALIDLSPGRNQAINILVADDHPTFRKLLTEMLAEAFPLAGFWEAGDGDEALAKLRQQSIDLLLLDINMPRRSGLEILGEVRTQFPQTRVLVVSIHDEDQYVALALDAGAHGYLNKDKVPDELIPMVESVLGTGPAGEGGSQHRHADREVAV